MPICPGAHLSGAQSYENLGRKILQASLGNLLTFAREIFRGFAAGDCHRFRAHINWRKKSVRHSSPEKGFLRVCKLKKKVTAFKLILIILSKGSPTPLHYCFFIKSHWGKGNPISASKILVLRFDVSLAFIFLTSRWIVCNFFAFYRSIFGWWFIFYISSGYYQFFVKRNQVLNWDSVVKSYIFYLYNLAIIYRLRITSV